MGGEDAHHKQLESVHVIRDEVLLAEGTFQVTNGVKAGRALEFSILMPRSE